MKRRGRCKITLLYQSVFLSCDQFTSSSRILNPFLCVWVPQEVRPACKAVAPQRTPGGSVAPGGPHATQLLAPQDSTSLWFPSLRTPACPFSGPDSAAALPIGGFLNFPQSALLLNSSRIYFLLPATKNRVGCMSLYHAKEGPDLNLGEGKGSGSALSHSAKRDGENLGFFSS